MKRWAGPVVDQRAEALMANAPATDAERRTHGRRSIIRGAARQVRMELLTYAREPIAIVFIFAYPILMMTLFSSTFAGVREYIGPGGQDGVSFAQYFLPGVVATAVVLSSVQLIGIQVAQDRETGMLKRLRATPMPPLVYFLGLLGQVILALALQLVILLVAARLVWDVTLPTTPSAWVTFTWVCLTSAAAGASAGIAIGGLMPSARAANAFLIPFLLLLQFISGVFIAFPDLPAWMQNLSAMFSLKWTAQGLRSVFLPEAFAAAEQTGSWQLGLTAVVLGVWILVWGAVALRTFRWLPRGAS
ncbi:MAG: ABC transporter permease [Bifidobacteriaceae bacterium]|jgi:ABC-2 type transport system permease protein|nr:ABC transporter permease [Bifidobacteriaceae bacterium]